MEGNRGLSFLKSIAVAAVTGAASGAFCASGKVPDENREIFTGMMVDLALKIGNQVKQKDREGYFPGYQNY